MDTSKKDSKAIEQLTRDLARLYSDFDRLFVEVGRIRDSVARRIAGVEAPAIFHTLWTKAVGTSTYNKAEWCELEKAFVQRTHPLHVEAVDESICPWCEARQPVRVESTGRHVVVCDHCGEGYTITIRHKGIVVISPPRVLKKGVEKQQVAGDPRGVCGCPRDQSPMCPVGMSAETFNAIQDNAAREAYKDALSKLETGWGVERWFNQYIDYLRERAGK